MIRLLFLCLLPAFRASVSCALITAATFTSMQLLRVCGLIDLQTLSCKASSGSKCLEARATNSGGPIQSQSSEVLNTVVNTTVQNTVETVEVVKPVVAGDPSLELRCYGFLHTLLGLQGSGCRFSGRGVPGSMAQSVLGSQLVCSCCPFSRSKPWGIVGFPHYSVVSSRAPTSKQEALR